MPTQTSGRLNVKPNTLFTNDNLFVLNGMNDACVDLIYLDPPFNSKRFYSAPIGSKAAGASFKDMWSWDDVDFALLQRLNEQHPDFVRFIESISAAHGSPMRSYITYMAQRVLEMHRVLKDTGSLYLHCDPTASHYLKIMLDFIFGNQNFRNEIVWHYKTGGAPKDRFAKKHDVIFSYSKTKDAVFNIQKEKSYTKSKQRKPGIVNYGGGNAKFFQDEFGVYNMVNMRDVWEIAYIGSTDKERTGYPTQKPLALLKRIIESSSNEGDVVLDPFCGCATTCVAAQHLRRVWIGIDVEKKSGELIARRLADDVGTLFNKFVHRTDLPQRTDLVTINLKNQSKKRTIKTELYGKQQGNCKGCKDHFKIQHFHIDHVVPRAKGGGDFQENLQLLCGNCNSIKGARPMEYLEMVIQKSRSQRQVFIG